MANRTTFSMTFVVLLVVMMVQNLSLLVVNASCTVKNNSGKNVVIYPTVDVSVSITVAAGASVDLPATQAKSCYLKNENTGHQLGPFSFDDGSIVACVDGSVSGTIDVYANSQSLVSSVLQLLTCLPLVSVCVSL